MIKLTRAQRRHLQWIADREPVGAFTADGPRLYFVRRLKKLGLIEAAGVEPGRWGFTRYALTGEGRRAMEAASETEAA